MKSCLLYKNFERIKKYAVPGEAKSMKVYEKYRKYEFLTERKWLSINRCKSPILREKE